MAKIHTCPSCGKAREFLRYACDCGFDGVKLRHEHRCDADGCGQSMLHVERVIHFDSVTYELCSERCAELKLIQMATELAEKNPVAEEDIVRLYENYHVLRSPWRCGVCGKVSRPPNEGGSAGFALITPRDYVGSTAKSVSETTDNQSAVEVAIVSGLGMTRACSWNCVGVAARGGEKARQHKEALDRIEREFADYAKATWWQYAWRRLLYRLRLIFTT